MLNYSREMEGKVAIVTGAGAGVGKDIVRGLVEQGVQVVAIGNNYGAVEKVARESVVGEDEVVRAIPMYCDVSNRNDVQRVVEDTYKRYHRIDYLINNAGISEVDFIPKIKEHHWDKIFDVNVKGTFLMTQAVVNVLIPNKQTCSIVNIVSESAHSPHTMCAAYAASKAAQMMFTKVSAREMIQYGIRVNAINPCIIEGTELTSYLNEKFKNEYDWTDEEAQKMYTSKIPSGRLCKVEDVTKAALWLLSKESDFVIGDGMMVSGGQAI